VRAPPLWRAAVSFFRRVHAALKTRGRWALRPPAASS
jgi:hypothetical protein